MSNQWMNLPIDDDEDQYLLGKDIDLDEYFIEPTEDYSCSFDLKNLVVEVAEMMPGFPLVFSSTEKAMKVNKLPIEEKKIFLKYLKCKKEEGIDIGERWAVFKIEDKYHLYGANIVLRLEDERKRRHKNLITTLERETSIPKTEIWKKIVLGLLFVIPALIASFLYFSPEFWVKVKDVVKDVEHNLNIKPDSVLFLEKEFPNIASWGKDNDKRKREVAKKIFNPENIDGIWSHVTSGSWNSGLSGELLRKAQARFVLYDLINYHPEIKNICKQRALIQGTKFQATCEIYGRSYKSKIFYWKTGNIKIPSKFNKIEDIFNQFNMPISDKNYEYCYNKELAAIEMDNFEFRPLKINEKPINASSDWLMVVVKDIKKDDVKDVVLFKVGVPVPVADITSKMLMGDKRIDDNTLITWHSIPQNIVDIKAWKDEHAIQYQKRDQIVLFDAPAFFGDLLEKDFLQKTKLDNGVLLVLAQEMLLKNAPKQSEKDSLCEKNSALTSMEANSDGMYGSGYSTDDPIEARLMHNILNTYTVPGLRQPKKSELHESHINIISRNSTAGSQLTRSIARDVLSDYINADFFTVTVNGKELNYRNLDKEGAFFPSPNDFVYWVDKQYDKIYFTNQEDGFKGVNPIIVNGKKTQIEDGEFLDKFLNE